MYTNSRAALSNIQDKSKPKVCRANSLERILFSTTDSANASPTISFQTVTNAESHATTIRIARTKHVICCSSNVTNARRLWKAVAQPNVWMSFTCRTTNKKHCAAASKTET